jgi:hypothetical protein
VFAVAATTSLPPGVVTVRVVHLDATRSGMFVEASLAWTDPDPARIGPGVGQLRYTVTDATACPTLPAAPPEGFGVLPTVPDIVNIGYPTTRQFLPDGAPSSALRCHYPRGSDRVLASAATASRAYDAASAGTLAERLRTAPIGQLHARIDLTWVDSNSLPLDLLIMQYPGRAPVTISFLGYGVSNGDIVTGVRHVNALDGSPLWLPGTGELDTLLGPIS